MRCQVTTDWPLPFSCVSNLQGGSTRWYATGPVHSKPDKIHESKTPAADFEKETYLGKKKFAERKVDKEANDNTKRSSDEIGGTSEECNDGALGSTAVFLNMRKVS